MILNYIFLNILLINLPVSIICIGKIIKLYLGNIKKNENIKIYNKYKAIIKFKFFEWLIDIIVPKNEAILITTKGTIWRAW